MLELFCQADHGPVMGFQKNGQGKIAPVLAEPINSAGLTWGTASVQSIVAGFSALAAPAHQLAILETETLRNASLDLLRAFCCDPAPDEAREWGAFLVSQDQGARIRRTLAKAYSPGDLAFVLKRGQFPRRHDKEWQNGTWAATPRSVRFAMKATRKARRLLLGAPSGG
jgi:hypothetical protein